MGALLALSGGFMDSYSYIFRNKVFANAQTGNIILLSINLAEHNFSKAFNYFLPVIAFTIGIVLADFLKYFSNKYRLHWIQISIIIEIVVLSFVAFIPTELNLIANSLTSFACGIQVESFRKIHSHPIATTMCIGNLRSGTENLYNYLINHDKLSLSKSLLYYGIIIVFAIGAVLGNFFINIFKAKAIFFSCFVLFVAFILMFFEERDYNRL